MLKRKLLTVVSVLFGLNSFAQLNVTNVDTPQQLVENILLGPGVVASNFSFNGVPVDATVIQQSVGFFDANGTAFPISSGVVMSSGFVSTIAGSGATFSSNTLNTGSDPDLALIEPAGINDRCVIEFDFIPAGDTISFDYMFGSEEYPEFVNSGFNDAFGFFISGPGFAGPYSLGAENIALIPGTTTPVTIDNVNAGMNSQYYVDNANDVYGVTTQMDAFTVVLTASASVQCGQTYHIKLALGDAGDSAYDSAVFLAADSFASEAVEVSVATVTGDTSIVEGCTDATFIFSRPAADTLDTLIINYDISGSATEGLDFNNLINPVTFLPGEDTVILNVFPYDDNLTETPEFITITTYTISACGDTITSEGTLWIKDPPLAQFTPNVVIGCQPLGVTLTNSSTDALTYEWDFGNGNVYTVGDTLAQTDTLLVSGTITMVAFDQYLCSDTTEVGIQVDICGCMDPIADNYNPIANVDDGSCEYSYPEVTAPNIFTPNGDGDNDVYELITTNAVNIRLTILNRWGNEMFSAEGLNPSWDGTINGTDAAEGTYFYTYTVTGPTGDSLEGHGFLQLVRD
jgi:gliding motility-associated-like protein